MVNWPFKILHYLMFFGGAFFFLFPLSNGKCFTYNCHLYLVFFLSFAFSFFAHRFIEKHKIGQTFKLLVDIALWSNILGELYFYYNFVYYDKILHLILPIIITLVVFRYFKINLKTYDKMIIFFTVMGGLVIFEVFEYLIFTFVKYPMMGVLSPSGDVVLSPLDDTFIDLIGGMLSTIITVLLYKTDKPVIK